MVSFISPGQTAAQNSLEHMGGAEALLGAERWLIYHTQYWEGSHTGGSRWQGLLLKRRHRHKGDRRGWWEKPLKNGKGGHKQYCLVFSYQEGRKWFVRVTSQCHVLRLRGWEGLLIEAEWVRKASSPHAVASLDLPFPPQPICSCLIDWWGLLAKNWSRLVNCICQMQGNWELVRLKKGVRKTNDSSA